MLPHRTLTALALTAAVGSPAMAHHGKDFMLLSTDDLPIPGQVYVTVSSDTVVDNDGARSTEVSPGLLVRAGSHWALEPHFHVARSAEQSWRYEASAMDIRYAAGTLPGSEWRAAVSLEGEKPKDSEERSKAVLRLALVRTYPRALVAVNLLGGKELAPGGQRSYSVGLGYLTPLPSGDRVGVEALARLPFADGAEIVPGYYHSAGRTSVKLGVGLFTNRGTTTGTLHAAFIRML